MAKAVFCIAVSEAQAERIVNELKNSGFSYNDISVLFPDKAGTKHFAHEQHTKAPEGATAGASTGGILAGAVGWLAGIGALTVPGLGPFIAAGPLMAALSAAAVGAAVGGIAGALVGMGFPEYEAKRYQGRIQTGNILISVHAATSEQTRLAKNIFREAGAEDVAVASESAVKEGESVPRDGLRALPKDDGGPASPS